MCGPDLFKKRTKKSKKLLKTDIEEKKKLAAQQAAEESETVAVRTPPIAKVAVPEIRTPLTTPISTPTLPVAEPVYKSRGPPQRLVKESGTVAGGSRVEEKVIAQSVTESLEDRSATPLLVVKSAQEYKEIGQTTVQKAAAYAPQYALVTDTAEIGVGLATDVTSQAATTAKSAAKTANVTIHDSLVAPVADTVVGTATSAVQTTVNVVAPIADTVVEIPKTLVGGVAMAAGGAAGVVATAAHTVAEIPKTLAGGVALAAGGAAGAVVSVAHTAVELPKIVAGGAAYAAGGAVGAASRVSATAQNVTAHIADPIVDTVVSVAHTAVELPKTVAGGAAYAAGGAVGAATRVSATAQNVTAHIADPIVDTVVSVAHTAVELPKTVAGGAAYAAGGAAGAATLVSATAQNVTAHIADPIVDTAQAAGYRANVTVHDVVALVTDTFVSGLQSAAKTISPGKKVNLDDAVAAEEAALIQKPRVEQVMEGAVYKKTAVTAEDGGRGQNPIFGVFTRKK